MPKSSHTLALTIRIDLSELGSPHVTSGSASPSTPVQSMQLSARPTEVLPSTDLSLPAYSTLAECLDDILDLIGAPTITLPWEFRTAAGRELDPCVPLTQLGIPPGSVVVLSPHRELPAPILKDAAESLLDIPATFNSTGLAASAFLISALGLGALAWTSRLPTLSSPLLLLLLSLTFCALCLWLKLLPPVIAGGLPDQASSSVIAVLAWAFCLVGTFALIVQHRPLHPGPQVAWAALAALTTAGILVVVCLLLADIPIVTGTILLTSTFVTTVSCLMLFAFHSFIAVAASIVVTSLLLLTWSAPLSIQLSGLTVPQLPSAGQDLKVSDHPIHDAASKAQRASTLLDALLFGLGLTAGSALVFLGSSGGGFSSAFCLTSTFCVLLHAVRHRSPRAMWGLWLWALAGLAGAVLSVWLRPASDIALSVVILSLFVGISAPLWAGRVRTLPATTISWLEKLETLAIAAALPIGVHLIGLFAWIRGLG
ncbi:type VII secretion integral membrane protein EccD [Corynebacterium epidermidicanis]|uniref:Type VII secretion integral membrane protein EccD n=1 Tax=Corynebacterium epidermidicanis TaxID=1050174 RepID=A0A0G3GTZ6_9CORY|nr:type VII secretion integral membrane protein EccD [Corynebacterium epidermidicanis]AKK02322.1 type VII secretion integral membrane protein EccD [Corynebacterium epidermidicanis]